MTTTALHSPRAIFRRATGPRGALLGFLVTLALGLLLLVGAATAVGLATVGQVLPGVNVAGVHLGGLDGTAAAAKLRDALPSLTAGHASLSVDGEPVTVSYADVGRGYEIEQMVAAALALGREGNPLTSTGARLRSVITSTALPVIVHSFDEAAMDALTIDVALRFTHASSDASVATDDADFVVTPAVDGMRLDPRAVRAVLAPMLATADPGDVSLSLSTERRPAAVSTEAAQAAADAATAMAASALSLTLPDDEEPLTFSPVQLAALVRFGPVGGTYAATVDQVGAKALVASLAEQVDREAKSAGFTYAGAGPTGVVAGVTGRELDADASLAAFTAALAERASGASVPSMAIATAITEPPLTTAAAQAAVGKMQRLSTWTTYYAPGISNYWGANISIPAWDIDGRILAPGEWFSFWNGIGPVTTARGYGSGGVIINGRSYPTGALAGGICSTSTTIFNAALRAGLNIGDRTNHSYYISRYPLGLDATVLRTDTSVTDMTFQNDTSDPILIRAYAADGFVRFDMWGVPTGRTISFSTPYVTNQRAARDLTVTDASLAPGSSVRDESPHDGMNVSVTRRVFQADGTLLHENTFFSPYRTVDGIVRVGPQPAPADPPEPA
ncbi:MAG: VanW family protein [Chloroflexota bacterium]